MPPAFPQFKPLELEDQPAIETLTRRYPPYSDLEFASLWAWNVREEMAWCMAGDTLVLRFSDYATGRPFLTFLGDGTGVAEELLALSAREGWGPALLMVPEVSVQTLDSACFTVEESRDHFDYLYDLTRYVTFAGGALKGRRNFLNGFRSRYPDYTACALDLSCPHVCSQIAELWGQWQDNRGFAIPHESEAYRRFLAVAQRFECVATGIFVEGTLAAFNITALLPGGCGNGLFEKADTRIHGIYSALMHEVAKAFLARGYTRLNYEQDLGIEQLRRAKLAFAPVGFLKKYSVRIVA